MDLSNFDKDHVLYDNTNKGKLGYLKSEVISPIKEFVGLKPNMYAYVYAEKNVKKTGKGIKKATLKNISFES